MPNDPLAKLRAQPMPDNITYAEWIGDPRRWATREQVVAFHNLAMREQIAPLINNAIRRYDAERRANRWYRRLGRWLVSLLPGVRRERRVAPFLAVERQKMASADGLTGIRFPESEAPRDG